MSSHAPPLITLLGLSTPRGLSFSDVTDSSAVVHWSMPRSAVDNYRVTYVPFEGGRTFPVKCAIKKLSVPTISCLSSTGSPVTVTVDGGVFEALLANMIPGKKYQVTVSSVKGLEESDPSMDTVTTGGLASTLMPSCRFTPPHTSSCSHLSALDRPQTLTALNVTDTSALLLWQPCTATVDSYVITYSAESGVFFFHFIINVGKLTHRYMCPAVPPIVEHVSGNTVEFEMGSLVPGMRYKVGVHAVKQALKSNPTVTEFTTGRADPHAAFTAVPQADLQCHVAFTDVDPPRDLKAINIQTDGATLTWKPPQAAVTGYTLTFTADGVIRVRRPSPTPQAGVLSLLDFC